MQNLVQNELVSSHQAAFHKIRTPNGRNFMKLRQRFIKFVPPGAVLSERFSRVEEGAWRATRPTKLGEKRRSKPDGGNFFDRNFVFVPTCSYMDITNASGN